jgi:ribosomal protein S12 methylthiotransferase accessory factor
MTTAPVEATGKPASPGAAAAATAAKVYFSGTHRVRRPEHTWEIIAPQLPRFGITRIADVTGLDTLGVPVVMSVRPLATTLSVSQGKGQSIELARISAAMEAIELWHAERVRPPASGCGVAAARDLELPYRLADITEPGSLIGDATPLDWVDATGMLTGARVPVPADAAVYRRSADHPWQPAGLEWNSNGLASGNNWHEACLHALYEVVERDSACGPGRDAAVPVDVRTIDDPGCAALVERMLAAGATLAVGLLPSRLDIPVFRAAVWSPEFPVTSIGWGAHGEAGVALSRAVTEAAQSRLTAIVGSRDDLSRVYDHVRTSGGRSPAEQAPGRPWSRIAAGLTVGFADVAAELRWLCEKVARVTGREPLAVDLSTRDDFAVVKVFAPGLFLDIEVVHPRV